MLIDAPIWFNWVFFCRSVPPELLRSFISESIVIQGAELPLVHQTPEAASTLRKEMTIRLSGAMGPIFLLLIGSGCFLAEGILSTEEKQMSEILKRLEAKLEKQDTVINELHGKNEALTEMVERMETKANKTEEALMTIRDSSTGGKAVRDLPYIMMCAFRSSKFDTGIIAYDRLTLDYSNCDRPGETLFFYQHLFQTLYSQS